MGNIRNVLFRKAINPYRKKQYSVSWKKGTTGCWAGTGAPRLIPHEDADPYLPWSTFYTFRVGRLGKDQGGLVPAHLHLPGVLPRPEVLRSLGLRAYWRRRGAVGVPSRVPVKVGLEGQRHRSCSSTITRLGDGAVTVRVRSASRVRLPEVPRTSGGRCPWG